MNITFVIPVFNERETLRALVEGIVQYTKPHPFRILFVDDGSTDGSYEELQRLQREYPCVDVIRLRGNFGKSIALAAGFARARGDLIFTMDSDLQDDPKEIPRFLEKLNEGYDMVCGWKAIRHDPWHKTYPSRVYNAVVAWLFDLPLHDVNCGFKLMTREVVKHLRIYGEMHRLIPVYAHSLNFRVTEIPVEHHRRRYGKSKFGLERFSRGAIDVLTTWFLTRYRHQPAHFFSKFGFIQLFLGLCAMLISFWGVGEPTRIFIWILGIGLGVGGGLSIALAQMAEFILYHFVRIDPALFIAENGDFSD